MIEHILTVLCDKASIDDVTKSVSLFNIIEQITVFTKDDQSVNLPFHFELVSIWTKEDIDRPANGRTRVYFCDPTDKRKTAAELDIDLSNHMFYRTRLMANLIQLNGPGKYKFVVELKQEKDSDWVKVASIPVLVIYQHQEEQMDNSSIKDEISKESN